MAQEFILNDPGEGIHEAEIKEVLVSVGDTVGEGDDILVVETDKAAVEVSSPFSGVVEEIRVSVGDIAQVGDVLMVFGANGDSDQGAADDAGASDEVEAPENATEPEGAGAGERKDDAPADEKDASADEKKDTGPEDAVEPIDDDENTHDHRERDRDGTQADADDETRADVGAESGSGTAPDDETVAAAPAARRIAREAGVDIRDVVGSGSQGHVTEQDVRAFVRKRGKGGRALPDFERWGTVRREPVRSIRRATATHMAQAWSEIPHVLHQDEVDITDLEAFRLKSMDEVENVGARLTLTAFIVRAVALALRKYPIFNASFDAQSEEIVFKEYCNIGVAVDTDGGLLVPVIRDVQLRSVRELAIALTKLAERARDGKADRNDMTGGCFTITNVGPLGGRALSPIINHPEVAILGVAKARWVPVLQDPPRSAEVRPRLLLPLCFAFDHRVADGADAARFVSTIMRLLEDPARMALGA